jgi:hypothetical protein
MKLHVPLVLTMSLAAALALTACNQQPESTAPAGASTVGQSSMGMTPPPAATPAPATLSVASVDLGTGVDAGNKVTTPMTTFAPTDTIYASVNTTGAANGATLAANWTGPDGQTVNQSSTSISPTGDASTAFHISKPGGLATGSYKVEISLNGAAVASKDFTVQ